MLGNTMNMIHDFVEFAFCFFLFLLPNVKLAQQTIVFVTLEKIIGLQHHHYCVNPYSAHFPHRTWFYSYDFYLKPVMRGLGE